MNGHAITMLGTGLIGDFYTTTLHGQRGRDRVRVVYSRSEPRGAAFRERWGIPAIFLSRFLPGLRAMVPVFAGVTHVPFWKLALPLASASGTLRPFASTSLSGPVSRGTCSRISFNGAGTRGSGRARRRCPPGSTAAATRSLTTVAIVPPARP